MSSITERMKIVIQCETGATRRFKELELATNIPSETWRTYWNRDARPSAEMIESVCKKWPQYAFWLSTGITDPERGHIAPPSTTNFFPVVKGIEQKHATEEFRYLIEKEKAEPFDENEKVIRKRRIEDEILAMRENEILPRGYLSYERIIRELGEAGRAEFFLLELDKKLNEIKALRNSEEESLRKPIKEWRDSISINEKIDKAIQFLLNPFAKKN